MRALFPQFITSPIAFGEAKAFWKKLACEAAEQLGQRDEWEKWAHEEEWCDDPALVDGAVVLTLFSASQHKGLRVQQSALGPAVDPPPHVTSFVDVAGEGFYDRPIPNLFIGAVPTEENQELLRRLVRHWFRKDVSLESMRIFIEAELHGRKG